MLHTKLAVYRAVVTTSLLYGCETWMLYRKQLRALDQFHIRYLHKIMGERISNTEGLRRADMPGIKALITKAQLRWVGHVIWMNDSHLPRMVFFSELASDARNIGRRLKRFKDCLKTSLVACGIPFQGWGTLASDRSAWRLAVHKGVNALEKSAFKT